MPSEEKEPIQIPQGTLDLIVLRVLASMGAQHAYQIATRLQQVSDRLLNLNQGILYPALVRLEQYGWIKGRWGRTESNREAKILCNHQSRRKSPQPGNAALAQGGRACGTTAC